MTVKEILKCQRNADPVDAVREAKDVVNSFSAQIVGCLLPGTR